MDERAKLKYSENEKAQQDNQNEKDNLMEPFSTNCATCGATIITKVNKEFNLTIIPYSIILLYFYGLFYGSILFGITFLLFQNIIHTCPNCTCDVASKPFYPIKQKGPFYSITYGKMTIILKKIYIHILIFLVLLFGIYINIINYSQIKNDNQSLIEDSKRNNENRIIDFYNSTDTELSWETLIKECGAKVMVENSARAIEIFNKKYSGKTIQWKGYFINAFINRLSQLGMVEPDHLVNINVRMIPSETLKAQDLLLSMGRKTFLENYESIKNIKTGTPIEFRAIFESIGDEWKPHHLHLEWIKITEDFMKDKVNITLFKGINFSIEGHMEIKNALENFKSDKIIENKTNIDNNIIAEQNDKNITK